jgi:hypothetical protein
MREDMDENALGKPHSNGATSYAARARDVLSRRKFAMAVLDQLQQDFAAMGKSRQAKPLLRELMVLAKTARPRSDLFL